jgi:hypothetical protein
MASAVITAVSLSLAFPLLSVPSSSLSFSSSSNTLRFPLRRASLPLAIVAFKVSETSLVPIPQESTQPLVDEDALPLKPGVYNVYDPTEEL